MTFNDCYSHLPLELIDDIIETIIQNTPFNKTVPPVSSTIALVSHRFRHHVNKRQFSNISVDPSKAPLGRFHAAVNLMKLKTWTKFNGIAHHVTRMQLHWTKDKHCKAT